MAFILEKEYGLSAVESVSLLLTLGGRSGRRFRACGTIERNSTVRAGGKIPQNEGRASGTASGKGIA